MEKFGIEVVVLESTEVLGFINGVLKNRGDEIRALIGEWRQAVDISRMNTDKLEKMAALEISILSLAKIHGCSVVSGECWHLFLSQYGIRPCFVYGDLTQKGLPVSCENDIHGSITSALLLGATRMQTPTFLADVTIRHPDNDNAELLWHCGPFPSSLARPNASPCVVGDGMGSWELKGGDVTLARFDAEKGNYKLFSDECRAIDGPATDGNYVWVETSDWAAWEKKAYLRPLYSPHRGRVRQIPGYPARNLQILGQRRLRPRIGK